MSSKYCAHVEDAEDDGSSSVGIESTRRYAQSEAPSPMKQQQQPNTSKSRAEKQSGRRPDSSGDTSLADSDSTERSSTRDREARRAERAERADRAERAERDKERRRKEKKRDELQARKERAERAERAELKAAAKEREAKPVKKTRPASLTQARTDSVVHRYRRGHVEDSAYFGTQQPAVPGGRPRAQTRPNSYYTGQNPSPMASNPLAVNPMSGNPMAGNPMASNPMASNPMAGNPMVGNPMTANPMAAHPNWAAQQQAQSGFPAGSFPPPMYAGGTPPSVVGMPPSSSPHSGYFNSMAMPQGNSHLKTRFDRPASAMGTRPQAQKAYGHGANGFNQDQYEPETESRLTRRTSRTKKQTEEDRRMMPPPPMLPTRPKSALPPSTPFRPPPPPSTPSARQRSRPPAVNRRGVGFADQQGYDDEDFLNAKHEMFADISPEPNYDRRSTALTRTRRGSVAYEQPGVDIMPAGRRSRTSSFYADRSLGTGGVSLDEDKYLTAMQYQDNMSGGPTMPLTAESLRKASTRAAGGGSRGSTRSSDSRDESEYQRSKTTGLTRSSSSDNDNVTIKLSGPSVVRVQGAEIQCDGGEITFSSGRSISHYGSDRASTVYQIEDGRSRYDRKAIAHRPRAPSQSDSQSRGYAQSYAPYDPTFVDDY